jgi:Growth-Arrest-Specific Protein 2 Domain
VARQHEMQMSEAKSELHLELLTASAYIVELEEKFYISQKTSLDLLRELKMMESSNEDLENEIQTLKNYIIDLKSRIAVYIPVKGDTVDKKIAEYINNYPDRQKLKIMFMRESEGVYQFGSKRVAVKVDKDKINIRVGGGFLSIDEFLDQYTPAELEKIERKDPMRRFSEKVAVQKTIVGHNVRESSPVANHSGPMSPTKSSSPRKIKI